MNYFKIIRKNAATATAATCHGVCIPTETILLKYPKPFEFPRNSRVHGPKLLRTVGQNF